MIAIVKIQADAVGSLTLALQCDPLVGFCFLFFFYICPSMHWLRPWIIHKTVKTCPHEPVHNQEQNFTWTAVISLVPIWIFISNYAGFLKYKYINDAFSLKCTSFILFLEECFWTRKAQSWQQQQKKKQACSGVFFLINTFSHTHNAKGRLITF